MESVEYIRFFNQVIDEFFRELIDIFPKENKIKVQYNLFQTVCKTNFRKPCTDFMLGSVCYLEKIAMRDESFFKGIDKPPLLSSLNFENLWTDSLSETTKKAIWKYIQSFFSIGIHVVSMPPETLPFIQYIINFKD